MSNITNSIEDLSREDLLKILERDRFVKEQLAFRIANLTSENVEMLGLVQEMQHELVELRQAQQQAAAAPDASP